MESGKRPHVAAWQILSAGCLRGIENPMNITAYRAAMAAQVALLVYFELCVLVPLGAWNNQPGHEAPFSPSNIKLGLFVGLGLSIMLVGTVRRITLLVWLGIASTAVWLVLHFVGLWMPYIRGASPQYARMYSHIFWSNHKVPSQLWKPSGARRHAHRIGLSHPRSIRHIDRSCRARFANTDLKNRGQTVRIGWPTFLSLFQCIQV